MTAFPAARPSLTVKSGAKYPAGVANGTGIATTLSAGLITSSLNYAALMPPADFEEGGKYVAVLNLLTGQYEKRELTSELAEPLEAEKYRVIPIGHPKYAEWGGYAANHARWQALITKAQTTGRPVQLGIGTYEIAALDWPPNVSLFGYGQTRTIVKFVGGHAENLLRFPLPAAYCNNLAYAPIEWRDVEIDFNGPAQTSGHGIVIQSPGTVGFYGTCPVFRGVRMLNAKENTFVTETGRNMMRLYDCRLNSGGSGHAVLIRGAMDSKIDRCYIGEHYSGVGVNFESGSGLQVTNTHIYSNDINFQKNENAKDVRFALCDFDRAERYGVVLYGNNNPLYNHNVVLRDCTFVYNSKQAGSAGIYSDIFVRGPVKLTVDGGNIPYFGAGVHESVTKHFIEFSSWNGNDAVPANVQELHFDPASANALWVGGFTNDFTKIVGRWQRWQDESPGLLYAESFGWLPISHPSYNASRNAAVFGALLSKAIAEEKDIVCGAGTWETPTIDNWPSTVGLRGYSKRGTTLLFSAALTSGVQWTMTLAAAASYKSAATFKNFTVNFNKSAQSAGVRGIVVKSPEVGSASYCVSPIFENVELMYAKGDCLTFETGRNLVILNNVRMWGGDAHGLVLNGYDAKLSQCNIGGFSSGSGVYVAAGGYVSIVNSHVFMNKNNLFQTANSVSVVAVNTDFDRALEHAVILQSTGNNSNYFAAFTGCFFNGSSSSNPGVYSDVVIMGPVLATFTGCRHGRNTDLSKTAYFVYFTDYAGVAPIPIYVYSPLYDESVSTWVNGFTNTWSNVVGTVSKFTGMRPSSSVAMSMYANNAITATFEQSKTTYYYNVVMQNSAMDLYTTTNAVDEKRFSISASSHNSKAWAGLVLWNDARDSPTLALGVKRTGNTFLTIHSGSLPASSAGLASGDYWRDAAAGNVVKQVP